MSAWSIQCANNECGEVTSPVNIADLLKGNGYRDDQGWFLCGTCGSSGYILKQFKLQEGGEWKPYLRGLIQPPLYGDKEGGYQPFAFLVSYSPEASPEDVWFAYYKDMRKQGGRLKMGYGPGGPPVFSVEDVLDLVSQMVRRGCLDAGAVKNELESIAKKLHEHSHQSLI